MAVVACTVLLLLVSGYLNAIAHFLVVEHERCDEHGQLVHGVHHEHDPSSKGVPAEAADSRSLLGIRGSESPEHEHEHCRVSVVSGTHVAPSETIAIIRNGVSAWSRRADDAPALESRTEDVCAFAPKTSPPWAV
jgi:hypothetical protein